MKRPPDLGPSARQDSARAPLRVSVAQPALKAYQPFNVSQLLMP